MLGIGLREHHQLDVCRIAPGVAERAAQVIDLIAGQRQTKLVIGLLEGVAAPLQQRNCLDRRGRRFGEQAFRGDLRIDQAFEHPIVQHCAKPFAQRRISRISGRATEPGWPQPDRVAGRALDALDRVEAAVARYVGGLGGPGRDRADARHDQELQCVACEWRRRRCAAVVEQRLQAPRCRAVQRLLQPDVVHQRGVDRGHARLGILQAPQQARGTKPG